MSLTFKGCQSNKDHVEFEKIRYFFSILFLITLWTYTHPYNGLIHDAALYAVQAFAHVYPDNYINEIFIGKLSQDNFTIFSYIYAYLIKLFGLNNSAILLLTTGYAIWFTAAITLLNSIFDKKTAIIILTILLSLSSYYGSNILAYNETFLTPRIFAEGLTLYAISFIVRQRQGLGIVFIGLAAAFHPLMSAGGLLYLIIYNYRYKHFGLFSIAILIITTILWYMEISPFGSIFNKMDTEWFNIVFERNFYVFISNLDVGLINKYIFYLTVTISAYLVSDKAIKRVLFTSILIGILSIIGSWITADIMKNVFFIQVQAWRSLWITIFFANISVGIIINAYFQKDILFKTIAIGYGIAWVLLIYSEYAFIFSILSLIVHLSIHKLKLTSIPYPRFIHKMMLFFFIISFAIFTFHSLCHILTSPDFNNHNTYDKIRKFLLFNQLILVGFGFIVLLQIRTISEQFSTVIVGTFLFAVLVFSIDNIDMRNEWTKKIESGSALSDLQIPKNVAKSAVVSWPRITSKFDYEDPLSTVWFILKRSSYADFNQGAGVLYSRETAIKYKERTTNLRNLSFTENWSNKIMNITDYSPTYEGLKEACSDKELDFIILDRSFKYMNAQILKNTFLNKIYYLYDCKEIRLKR